MKKVFWLNSQIAKAHEDGDQLIIKGYASTNDKDRVGDVILPDAWAKGGLENFKKNPVILFNHDYNQPIGRATQVEVDDKGLKLTAVISKEASQYGLIKDGVLSTFSVGFLVKDADYNEKTDGFVIKDAELLETSVVTVPCNQDATFSLSKSFNNREEFKEFVKEELHIDTLEGSSSELEANVSIPNDTSKTGSAPENNVMNPEEIQKLAAEAAQKMFADMKAAEKKAADEAAAKAADEAKVTAAAQAASKSVEEKLLADFDAKLKENNDNVQKTFAEFKEALESKEAELKSMRERKVEFSERGGRTGDVLKDFADEAQDAFLLARITGKGYETNLGKELFNKFNTHSTIAVGTDALETTVTRNIESDIQNELVIAPLFREIPMTSASMSIPVMPDVGYAEITAAATTEATWPNGNMDIRGAPHGAPYQGITLTSITLNTIKMMALSYLGNETEEDTVIPILPLIRDAMIRAHVRGVDNMILAGNDPDGVYTSGAQKGLIAHARTAGRTVTATSGDGALTAADLLGMRRVMGKYGLRPNEVVYIVSQDAYFDLMEDAEFQDADLVGANNAVKLTGRVGNLYGSQVLMSDEFAAPGPGRFYALALNRRNFVVPRLRGVTVESEYSVRNQHRVLVTTQRLGFAEIISNAPSVVGLRRPAA